MTFLTLSSLRTEISFSYRSKRGALSDVFQGTVTDQLYWSGVHVGKNRIENAKAGQRLIAKDDMKGFKLSSVVVNGCLSWTVALLLLCSEIGHLTELCAQEVDLGQQDVHLLWN